MDQVTKHPELFLMHWVLPETHQAIMLGTHSNIPSSNESGTDVIGPKKAVTVQASYLEEVAQMAHGSHSSYITFCLLV